MDKDVLLFGRDVGLVSRFEPEFRAFLFSETATRLRTERKGEVVMNREPAKGKVDATNTDRLLREARQRHDRMLARVDELWNELKGNPPNKADETQDRRSDLERGIEAEQERIARRSGRPVGTVTMADAMRSWQARDLESYIRAGEDHRRRFLQGVSVLGSVDSQPVIQFGDKTAVPHQGLVVREGGTTVSDPMRRVAWLLLFRDGNAAADRITVSDGDEQVRPGQVNWAGLDDVRVKLGIPHPSVLAKGNK